MHVVPSGPCGQGRRDASYCEERMVHAGRSHAALVFDGDDAVAWCQFGPPAEAAERWLSTTRSPAAGERS